MDRMSVEFVLNATLPPIETTQTDSFLETLQSIMARSKHKIVPRIQTEVIRTILAVDFVTGHVLTMFNCSPELYWIPYIYLRWACNNLNNKKWLDQTVLELMRKVIPPEYNSMRRIPITEFHRILPIYYIPRLNDGTLQGLHERVVYRLWGKSKLGVTTLKMLADCPGIDNFVKKRTGEIRRAYNNRAGLMRAMGLSVKHNDIQTGIPSPYIFKHFNFGFGPEDDEQMAISVLINGLPTAV